MKLFCMCDEDWLHSDEYYNERGALEVNFTRQIRTEIRVPHDECSTANYWYDADYENMMFDIRRMNK